MTTQKRSHSSSLRSEALLAASSDGDDTLTGTSGNDDLRGMGGNDTLRGLEGNDRLDGGTGQDSMEGGSGDDTYYVDNGNDVVVDAPYEGFDTVYTTVSYALGYDTEVEVLAVLDPNGTASIDLTGSTFANELRGNQGANVLSGNNGNDILHGYGGNDTLLGGEGIDYLYGGAGDDRLNGGNGFDYIYGGDGNDLFDATSSKQYADKNRMYGEAGNDTYIVDSGGDVVYEAAGGGYDVIYTSFSYGLQTGSEVEELRATGPAAFRLNGNELSNRLYGNASDNELDGFQGADTLEGGAGRDTFRFTTALGGGNVDRITDFSVPDDVIALDGSVFGLAWGDLPTGAFRTGSAAADADDRIIYNSATGALYFDADGNGAGAAVQFATLSAGLGLTASDFTVI